MGSTADKVVKCVVFISFVLLGLFGHCGQCSPLDLEYFNTVKQTFGLPGSLRTTSQEQPPGLRKPLGASSNGNKDIEDIEDATETVFGLTLVIVGIFGVILLMVITYFCVSLLSLCCRYLTRKREKRQRLKIIRNSTVSNSETETSSLDSVSTE